MSENTPGESFDESAVPPRPVAPQEAGSARKRISASSIGLIAVAIVAVAGWTAFGVTASIASTNAEQLTMAEDELAAAERDLSGVRIDLTEATSQRDALQASAADVAAREVALEEDEAALEAREAAVGAAEELKEATTLLDGYSYTVGETMEAGTYRADASGGGCYWKITRSGSNYSDIVDNDFGSKGAISVTVSKGQDFTSERCGDWTKVG